MNVEQVLKIGVVGFGIMGRKHTINASRIEGVEVVAVVSVEASEAMTIAAELKAPVYPSVKDMLASIPVDAVIVATPPGVRQEMVKAATSAGKPLFVEKPIALDLATAKAYCYDVKESPVVNAVGFQLRYSPLTQRAKPLISGRPVTHVRTACTTPYYLKMDMPLWYLQREYSGGPLLEQSIHVIDMARYLVGEITYVFGRGDRLTYPHLDIVDSEDTIALAYRFANGALGTHIDSCAMAEFNWEIELFGPNWRLLVDYARKQLLGHMDGEVIEEVFPENDLHMVEMQAFLEAVRYPANNGIRSDFVDATRTLAVVLAGDRSLVTGAWEPVEEGD